jgi:glycosyltransferase involved in cell wall biosynthesis
MNRPSDPLVSVVTPLYNGEKYLSECVESVLTQTYSNWDYTIVNNCSSDRSLEIAQSYAKKDPRIRIHNNQEFVGVIQNHNIAFRQISPASKYCKGLQADDWLFPECIEKMVRIAEDHPKIGIVASYALVGQQPPVVGYTGLPHSVTVDAGGRVACRLNLLGGPYIFGTSSTQLFRSDILRSRYAFYNEANIHADLEACLEFLGDNDFGFVHQVLVFRREQGGETISDFSTRLQTYLPERLYNLAHYGPKYLSEDEIKNRIRDVLRNYYDYLGRQVYKRRGREFWGFHKKSLVTLGYPLSRSRLTAAAFSYALDIALNPKRGLEGVARRIARSVPRPA